MQGGAQAGARGGPSVAIPTKCPSIASIRCLERYKNEPKLYSGFGHGPGHGLGPGQGHRLGHGGSSIVS